MAGDRELAEYFNKSDVHPTLRDGRLPRCLQFVCAPRAYPLIDFDEYENKVMSLAFYPERGTGSTTALSYCAMGLNEEAGEAAGKVKKSLRDDGGILTPERKEALKKELGDVLWYVTALAREAGFSLREIAEGNIEKLFDRAKRGTLGGSGDSR
jgi:NTP pyrophosphatase (non-canonical NTP hydrolase)